jgi:hypothetical protein
MAFSTSSPESFRGFTFTALGDGNVLQRFDATEIFVLPPTWPLRVWIDFLDVAGGIIN